LRKTEKKLRMNHQTRASLKNQIDAEARKSERGGGGGGVYATRDDPANLVRKDKEHGYEDERRIYIEVSGTSTTFYVVPRPWGGEERG